jgi:ABC-type multidrug transport system ATPase subunit
VGGFSGGMKQRLGIAIALAGSPKRIIVDEPTAGLDPNERHRFLNLLSEIGDDVIVILSTHIVEDVRELCRRMAIINAGELILQGDPSQVLDDVRGHIWRKKIRKSALAPAIGTRHLRATRRRRPGGARLQRRLARRGFTAVGRASRMSTCTASATPCSEA